MKKIKIKYKTLLSTLSTLVILGSSISIIGIEKDMTVRTVNANVKISTAVVKNIVFKNANVDKSDTRITKLMLTKHKKTFLYDIIFFTKNKKYSYTVDANNGQILKNTQEDRVESQLKSKARWIFGLFSSKDVDFSNNTGMPSSEHTIVLGNEDYFSRTPVSPMPAPPVASSARSDDNDKPERAFAKNNTELEEREKETINNELVKIKDYIENNNYEKAYSHFFEKYTYFTEKMNEEDLEYTVHILKQFNEETVKTKNKKIYNKNIIKFKTLGIF